MEAGDGATPPMHKPPKGAKKSAAAKAAAQTATEGAPAPQPKAAATAAATTVPEGAPAPQPNAVATAAATTVPESAPALQSNAAATAATTTTATAAGPAAAAARVIDADAESGSEDLDAAAPMYDIDDEILEWERKLQAIRAAKAEATTTTKTTKPASKFASKESDDSKKLFFSASVMEKLRKFIPDAPDGIPFLDARKLMAVKERKSVLSICCDRVPPDVFTAEQAYDMGLCGDGPRNAEHVVLVKTPDMSVLVFAEMNFAATLFKKSEHLKRLHTINAMGPYVTPSNQGVRATLSTAEFAELGLAASEPELRTLATQGVKPVRIPRKPGQLGAVSLEEDNEKSREIRKKALFEVPYSVFHDKSTHKCTFRIANVQHAAEAVKKMQKHVSGGTFDAGRLLLYSAAPWKPAKIQAILLLIGATEAFPCSIHDEAEWRQAKSEMARAGPEPPKNHATSTRTPTTPTCLKEMIPASTTTELFVFANAEDKPFTEEQQQTIIDTFMVSCKAHTFRVSTKSICCRMGRNFDVIAGDVKLPGVNVKAWSSETAARDEAMVAQLQKEAAEMAAKKQPAQQAKSSASNKAAAAPTAAAAKTGGKNDAPVSATKESPGKRSRTEDEAFGPASGLQGRGGRVSEEEDEEEDEEEEDEDAEAAADDAEEVAAVKQIAAAASGGPLRH